MAQNLLYCAICGMKAKAENNHYCQHNNKKGQICYGSFTPTVEINPFPNRGRNRWADEEPDPFLAQLRMQ